MGTYQFKDLITDKRLHDAHNAIYICWAVYHMNGLETHRERQLKKFYISSQCAYGQTRYVTHRCALHIEYLHLALGEYLGIGRVIRSNETTVCHHEKGACVLRVMHLEGRCSVYLSYSSLEPLATLDGSKSLKQ